MTFYYLEMYNLQCNIANVPSLVPGVQSRLEWPGPGWRGLARPGCLSPGPGPGTSQHANIVTVGRERERERETGREQLQSVSRRPRGETD